MNKLTATIILTFFISLGVMLGGCLIGSLGAALSDRPPMNTMVELAGKIKIWALVSALGGSFGIFEAFDTGLTGGYPLQIIQQFMLLLSAFAGAHLGYLLINALAGGR